MRLIQFLIFVLLLIIAIVVNAQGPLVRGGDGATWTIQKEYILKDGMTFKYIAGPDTARYFNRGTEGKIYELTISVKDITPAPAMQIQAEHAVLIERATLDPNTNGNTICCVTGTSINPTRIVFDGEKDTGNRSKIVINYARGNPGNGKFVISFVKNGVTNSHTYQLPPTGTNVWNNWQEITFDIPPNQVGIMTISTDMPGAWNLDWLAFK